MSDVDITICEILIQTLFLFFYVELKLLMGRRFHSRQVTVANVAAAGYFCPGLKALFPVALSLPSFHMRALTLYLTLGATGLALVGEICSHHFPSPTPQMERYFTTQFHLY